MRRRARRNGKKRDLGGGVETETEEKANRVHLPAVFDHAKQPAEQSCHDATGHELVVQRFPVVLAAPHPPVHADDVDQDHKVHDPDQDEECARDEGPHRTTYVPQLAVVPHHTLNQRLDREPKRERD